MSSLNYYNQNTAAFVERTLRADLRPSYSKLLPLLNPKACILDAGCGSGRDSLFFMQQGFRVLSFDASIEMVKFSTQLLGVETLHLNFQDVNFKEEFDAVWASASLLHVPYKDLSEVLKKLHDALKSKGFLYASFKHGSKRRKADKRIFYDMNENKILPYINGLFSPVEMWVSEDTRSQAQSPTKAWLHMLLQKQ